MHRLIYGVFRGEEGVALVEYAMLAGLIAVICLAAIATIGTEISNAFSSYAAALSNV